MINQYVPFDETRYLTVAHRACLAVVMRHGEARPSWRTYVQTREVDADVAGQLILAGYLRWHSTPHGLRIRPGLGGTR